MCTRDLRQSDALLDEIIIYSFYNPIIKKIGNAYNRSVLLFLYPYEAIKAHLY